MHQDQHLKMIQEQRPNQQYGLWTCTTYLGESVEMRGGHQIDSLPFQASTTYPDSLVANLTKSNSELWDNVKWKWWIGKLK